MGGGWGMDLRVAVRGLRRAPGFVLVAVLSLAIGVGANAAMFGSVRALLLSPMSVERPDELHLVTWRKEGRHSISQINSTDYPDPDGGQPYQSNLTYPAYNSLRDAAPDGVRLFAFTFLRGVSVAAGEAPALLAGGLLADGSYFDGMRLPMALGRPITPADDQPGAPLVAVLSHRFWMRAFGGDRSLIGGTIRVNGHAAEVVGVTAPGFTGVSKGGFFPRTEITLPLSSQPTVYPRWRSASGVPLRNAPDTYWLRVVARVPAEVATRPVEEVLTEAFRAQPMAVNTDGETPAELRLLSGSRGAQPVRQSSARMLYILLGMTSLVLLLACVNVAGLLLARGVARQREVAVRRALGSGSTRLVRQSLIESALLAGLGSLAGLYLAFLGRGTLGKLISTSAGGASFGEIASEGILHPSVVAFTIVLGCGATLLFGTLPSLLLSRVDPGTWLKHRSAGMGTPKLTSGRVLVALQIGVSVPLLVGSVLLLRTMLNIGAVELGFDPRGVATFRLDPAFADVPAAEHGDLYARVLEEVRRIPGVSSATLQEIAFLSGIASNNVAEIDGVRHLIYINGVGPDFLTTMGMRLLEGRMPGIQDVRGSRRVAAVNERLARDVFGGASPVGRTLTLGSTEYHVVGVVNDTRYRSHRAEVPATLFPSALQRTGYGGNHVVVRTSVPIGRLEAEVREAVARVNRDLPVPSLHSQEARVAESSGQERIVTQLLTLFAGFALLLASLGVHGVVAYSVGRRRSEIGIRVAVGARPGQVMWLVLRQVLLLSAAGLAIGVPGALAAGPVVESLLYGVAPTDPVVIGLTAFVLLATGVVAGYLPARRASRIDPLVALRSD